MANPTQQIHQPQNSPFNRYLTFLLVLHALPSRWLVIALFPDVLTGIQIPASHIPRRYSRYPPRRHAVAAGSALHLQYGQILSLGPPGACGRYLSSPIRTMLDKEGRSNRHAAVLGGFSATRGRTARLPCASSVGVPPAGGFIAALLWNMARSAPVWEGIDAQRGGVKVRGSKRVRCGLEVAGNVSSVRKRCPGNLLSLHPSGAGMALSFYSLSLFLLRS